MGKDHRFPAQRQINVKYEVKKTGGTVKTANWPDGGGKQKSQSKTSTGQNRQNGLGKHGPRKKGEGQEWGEGMGHFPQLGQPKTSKEEGLNGS